MSFSHLHVHSQYSLLEATNTTKKLAKRAAELGMPSVALTDNGNMFGAIEFFFACKDAGVKPLLGLEVLIAPKSRLIKGEDKDPMPNRRMVLLATNNQGYASLNRHISQSYRMDLFSQGFVEILAAEQTPDNPHWFQGTADAVCPA